MGNGLEDVFTEKGKQPEWCLRMREVGGPTALRGTTSARPSW